MNDKHVGFPLPSEMFHDNVIPMKEIKEEIDFVKHEAITRLLDIDLKCPHCNELLVKAKERKTQK